MSERSAEGGIPCSNCGRRVWQPGSIWLHWATGRTSCENRCADATP